jgi:hypothetical protein
MWALPTPQTVLAFGLDWELSHPISNCDDLQRLSLSFRTGLSPDAKVIRDQGEDSYSLELIP